MKGRGGIRFILELHFAMLFGEEKHLTRCVDPAAVQLVRLEDLFRTEVAQAAAARVKGVLARQVCHEAPEAFNPGVVLIPVEQSDSPLEHLLRCIERVTPLPLVVKEGVDVDPNPQLVLYGGDVGNLDGVLDLIHLEGVEEVVIILRSLFVFLELGECRGDRISKTSCVVIFDVDNRLLLGEEGGELLVCPPTSGRNSHTLNRKERTSARTNPEL